VALNERGEVVVADYGNKRVAVLARDGALLASLTGGASGALGGASLGGDGSSAGGVGAICAPGGGALQGPAGVAVGRGGALAVADAVLHRVVLLSPDGALAATYGSKGAGPAQLAAPRGRAAARPGNHRALRAGGDAARPRRCGGGVAWGAVDRRLREPPRGDRGADRLRLREPPRGGRGADRLSPDYGNHRVMAAEQID